METAPNRTKRSPLRRVAKWSAILAVTGMGLFCLNGWCLSHGETAIGGIEGTAPATPGSRTCRIMAWNLAKCSMHHGGLRFDSKADVIARLDGFAARIRREDPDLVFLSEVVTECTPCDVDMVRHLAKATGLAHWAFGENYNFGLPFVRIVGGNAILSRRPLTPIANPDLPGRKSIFVTRNNRRMLWCTTELGGETVLLGAVHTDSFDLTNNLRQTRAILQECTDRPAILAGDFNAEPHDASLDAVHASRRFQGAIEGARTYPARAPTQRIDYIFGPAGWKLIEHRVLPEMPHSDHRPVVSVFEVKS